MTELWRYMFCKTVQCPAYPAVKLCQLVPPSKTISRLITFEQDTIIKNRLFTIYYTYLLIFLSNIQCHVIALNCLRNNAKERDGQQGHVTALNSSCNKVKLKLFNEFF
jgi:hypothetical protein